MQIYDVKNPGGSDTHVQYNKNGIFGGATYLTYDDVNGQVTIGKTSIAYPFLINSTDGSNKIMMHQDDFHSWIRWSTGSLKLQTDKDTNTNTEIRIYGKGTGIGELYCYDQDNAEYVYFTIFNGAGHLRVGGTSLHSLNLQDNAECPIRFFSASAEGETQEFRIYGWGSGSGGLEHIIIEVEKGDVANTAFFHNIANYMFEGVLKSTNGAQLGDGGTTNYVGIDGSGVLGLNGLAGLQLPHMMQSDTTNQTVGTANVAQVVTFNTDVHHFGITRTTSSRFTILKEASYLIAISVVCDTDPGQSKDIEMWLRINGSDVANSNTILHLTADNEDILAVTYIKHFDVNDYFEFWMTGEDTDVRILATPAVTTGGEERPACPSIIMTCNYIGVD